MGTVDVEFRPSYEGRNSLMFGIAFAVLSLASLPSLAVADEATSPGSDGGVRAATGSYRAKAQKGVASQAFALLKKKEFDKAMALLKPAAENGDSNAQVLLGDAYHDGWGVRRSDGRSTGLCLAWGR